jgi:hypothetical protein
MTRLLIVLTAAAALAACNTSTEGANGNLAFTPTDCGLIACNLADSIGVGGVISMHIRGLEGVSTAGAVLESENPDMLSVVAVPDVGGQPTWELQALNAGVTRVNAYTADDVLLDFVEIPTQELTGLISQKIVGEAVGPTSDASYNEIWTVNADQAVSFQVRPVIGIDVPTMGRYVYTATVDSGMEAGLLEENLSDGYLYFNVPAGQYPVIFENDFGHRIDILIDAQ